MHYVKAIFDWQVHPTGHPCHSTFPFRIDENGMGMRVLSCSMREKGGQSIIVVSDPLGIAEEGHFIAETGECTISRIDSKRLVAIVENYNCPVSSIITKFGCFLTNSVPKSNTISDWTIVGQNKRTLKNLIDAMQEEGFRIEVVNYGIMDSTPVLTPKQEECFNIAMSLGYYEIPKRIDLDKLSVILGCSKSTLNVTLRTAEKKIFDYYRLLGTGLR